MKMYAGGPRLNWAFIYYISLESTISLVQTRVEDTDPLSEIQDPIFFLNESDSILDGESGSGWFTAESVSLGTRMHKWVPSIQNL